MRVLLFSIFALVGSIISLIVSIRSYQNIDRAWRRIKGVPFKEGSGNCPATFYQCEMCHRSDVEWLTGICPHCNYINNETPVSMAQNYGYSTKDPRGKNREKCPGCGNVESKRTLEALQQCPVCKIDYKNFKRIK